MLGILKIILETLMWSFLSKRLWRLGRQNFQNFVDAKLLFLFKFNDENVFLVNKILVDVKFKNT